MSYFMVDVETDGEIPGDFSMTELGVILVREPLEDAPTFYRMLKPISHRFSLEALKVSGKSRDELTRLGSDPMVVMLDFEEFVQRHNVGKRAFFISDNNGYDFMWVSWYAHHFLGRNPFGHSSTNLGSLYKGVVKDMFKNFKHLRQTKHTHNPVDDARGNAEALIHMKKEMGLNILLE